MPKISINSNFIKELKKQLINSYYFSFEFFDDNNNSRLILIRMICEYNSKYREKYFIFKDWYLNVNNIVYEKMMNIY